MASCSSCGKELPGEFPFCPFCGAVVAEIPGGSHEQRKVVTVLFCDVTGSSELGEKLDPEALRALLARYFERMKAIVERHGGSVEKFIGDAVLAVFGVPVVHEDDSLRALRAAMEMREALPELGLHGRIGVTTGEVVTGTDERLATGDALNVAARLEQVAQPDEILIGEETLRLTRHAVEVQAIAPQALKGKSKPVTAYRLVSVHGEKDFVRRPSTPMVGRETELRRLRDTYNQAVGDSSCQLFTILGPAGVGKSRLAAEFMASIQDSLVVRGRCLSYGEGISYWPVVEVVKQLLVIEPDRVAAPAIRALLGDQQMATSSAEIAWAFRRLLEAVASERPLVCVFDDVHWGEETFLDLVEHVADLSRDAPIMLLCMARPELLDRRAGWAGGKVNATSLLLEPLGPDDAELMIASLANLDKGLRKRIREAAEGNPLFVEQMVALAQDSDDGNVKVPPTIQALLAARIDQLDASERRVLERGAVEGRVFHRGAVQALTPEEGQVMVRLNSLVRKELVRPDKPELAGEEAFRFRHLLIRDAAYHALPKAMRAELHERFAVWLEVHGKDLVELDEILGYHLEQAYTYRNQLGPPDERGRRLAREAARHLADAGRRAFARGDMSAAVHLLERATALPPADDPERLGQLPTLGRALIERAEWERANAVLTEAMESGRAMGAHGVAADATVALAMVWLSTDPESTHVKVREGLDAAMRTFEQLDDKAGLARALGMAGMVTLWRGEAAAAIEELEQAARFARDAGERAQEMESLGFLLIATMYGPTPVVAGLEQVDEVSRRMEGYRTIEVTVLRIRAHLEAMRGQFDRARQLIAEARALGEELGLESYLAAGVLRSAGEIELLAGDLPAAEGAFRAACDELEHRGDWGAFASVTPLLADVLSAQGRGEEAAPSIELASHQVSADDRDAQIGLLRVRGRLQVQQGNLKEGERLARNATDLASQTDLLNGHARALTDLADVLDLAGKSEQAAGAVQAALALYERKGNLVMAERARERLNELPTPIT